jgi:serine/threonine-protein phosphatase 2A activator
MGDGEGADPLELCPLAKHIDKEADMKQWISSPAYSQIMQTLNTLNDSVKSRRRSTPRQVSPIIHNILAALDKVRRIIEAHPPFVQPQRFGNKAFRSFLSHVYDERSQILGEVTTNTEAHDYFCQSFGSWTRIDFGTGHELNFLAFVATLSGLGLLGSDDSMAVVFDVIWGYWDLIVIVHDTYKLEPAGSHGSWGVDDYVMLPFLFGSAQLINHPEVVPDNVTDPMIAKAYKYDYSYCRWIDYIYQVKAGAFCENSRMLWNLRKVPHFTKLNGGMIKMYAGEVMGRFQVVQHFRFGAVLRWLDDRHD